MARRRRLKLRELEKGIVWAGEGIPFETPDEAIQRLVAIDVGAWVGPTIRTRHHERLDFQARLVALHEGRP